MAGRGGIRQLRQASRLPPSLARPQSPTSRLNVVDFWIAILLLPWNNRHKLRSHGRGASMQMIQCPNCGKLSGFKRALGLGTFFMVILTAGLWLLVIPFYPARCINCGLTRGTAVTHNFLVWYRSLS